MPSVHAPIAYAMKGNTINNVVLPVSHPSWGWADGDLEQADQARICCNNKGVAITCSGIAPVSAHGLISGMGIILPQGATRLIKGNSNIMALLFVRAGDGDDAVITIELEKYS